MAEGTPAAAAAATPRPGAAVALGLALALAAAVAATTAAAAVGATPDPDRGQGQDQGLRGTEATPAAEAEVGATPARRAGRIPGVGRGRALDRGRGRGPDHPGPDRDRTPAVAVGVGAVRQGRDRGRGPIREVAVGAAVAVVLRDLGPDPDRGRAAALPRKSRSPTVMPITRARAIIAPPMVMVKRGRRPTRRRPQAHPRTILTRPPRTAVEASGNVPTRRLLVVCRALDPVPGPDPRIVITGSARAAAAIVIDRTVAAESLVTTTIIGTTIMTGDIPATTHPTSAIVIITTATDRGPPAPRVPRAMPSIPSPRNSGPFSYRSWS